MRGMRIVSIIVVCAAAFAAFVLGSQHWTGASPSATPPHYLPVPGGERGEHFAAMDAYWNDRLTYPTGRFNPAWLRQAARQDKRIVSRVPTSAGPRGTTWTALGPQPERMDGCTGCYNYHKTEGRINAIVVDPTTTTNGSIVAYSASVGGGVWKTTNCCSSADNVDRHDRRPADLHDQHRHARASTPHNHNTIYAGTGDLNFGSFSMGSQGILKSTDARRHLDGARRGRLRAGATPEPPGQFPQYHAVGKVRVDPNNSNNVVAGTKTGLYLLLRRRRRTGPAPARRTPSARSARTSPASSSTNMGGGDAHHRRGRHARFCDDRPVQPRNQNGANGIYKANDARQRLPDLHVDRAQRERLRLRHRGHRQPVRDRREHERRQRHGLRQSDDRRPARPHRHRGRAEQPERHLCPGAVDRGEQRQRLRQHQRLPARRLGARPTAARPGASWPARRRFAHELRHGVGGTATIRRTGTTRGRGRSEQPRPRLRRHVRRLARQRAPARRSTTSPAATAAADDRSTSTSTRWPSCPARRASCCSATTAASTARRNANAATPGVDPTWFNMDTGLNTIEFYSGDISGNFATAAEPVRPAAARRTTARARSTFTRLARPARCSGRWASAATASTRASIRSAPGPACASGRATTAAALSPLRQQLHRVGGASWTSVTGGWTRRHAVVRPAVRYLPRRDPRRRRLRAGRRTGGCGHLIAGTTRVWETITGGNAVDEPRPGTSRTTRRPEHDQADARQPLLHQPGQVLAQVRAMAIVGTNDGNVWIGFNLGTGTPNAGELGERHRRATPSCRTVRCSGSRSTRRHRREPADRLRGGRRLQRQHADHARPRLPGRLHGELRHVHLGRTRPATCPTSRSTRSSPTRTFPQQVFAGTDWGLYYTDDITAASPVWYRFENGMPHAMIWDMQIDRGATTLSVWTRSRGAYVWPLPGAGPRRRRHRRHHLRLRHLHRRHLHLRHHLHHHLLPHRLHPHRRHLHRHLRRHRLHRHRLHHPRRHRPSATSTASSTTATTDGALPGAEGDRTDARTGEDEDPPGALLGRPHPPRSLAASRPRDRPEPEARRSQAPRLPGQAGRRPALGTTASETREGRQSAPLSL